MSPSDKTRSRVRHGTDALLPPPKAQRGAAPEGRRGEGKKKHPSPRKKRKRLTQAEGRAQDEGVVRIAALPGVYRLGRSSPRSGFDWGSSGMCTGVSASACRGSPPASSTAAIAQGRNLRSGDLALQSARPRRHVHRPRQDDPRPEQPLQPARIESLRGYWGGVYVGARHRSRQALPPARRRARGGRHPRLDRGVRTHRRRARAPTRRTWRLQTATVQRCHHGDDPPLGIEEDDVDREAHEVVCTELVPGRRRPLPGGSWATPIRPRKREANEVATRQRQTSRRRA